MELTRRGFVNASVVAAGTVLAGAFAAKAAQAAEADWSSKVTKTLDADVVVVGAGISGLAAAVEAANEGANVVLLESQEQAGGNGNMISCVMGVGTKMQEKLGIDIKPADVIETELKTFNCSVDGSRWADVVRNSAENIDWLVEQGVVFCGLVDDYHGNGVLDTAHEFTEETGRDGGTCYVPQMVDRFQSLGGTFMTSTPARQLIMDGAKVAGVYAEGAEDVYQVNAKAVILATGGYANSTDILSQCGYDPDKVAVFGMPGHEGDGISLGLSAGAKSWLENSSLMEYPMNPTLGKDSSVLANNASTIWVNGDGKRFANEACGKEVPARPALALRAQDTPFALLSQAQLDGMDPMSDGTAVADYVKQAVSDGVVFSGDTLEEVAKAAGVDADGLAATVEEYNGFCEAGSDDYFGKDPSYLVAYEDGPFYLLPNDGVFFLTTIGGLDTTPTCEVRAEKGGVVEGLYAVGVDGVELYRGLYTIDIPGSCNANNVYTGRTAAKQACAAL